MLIELASAARELGRHRAREIGAERRCLFDVGAQEAFDFRQGPRINIFPKHCLRFRVVYIASWVSKRIRRGLLGRVAVSAETVAPQDSVLL